jgi:hypothetical protein
MGTFDFCLYRLLPAACRLPPAVCYPSFARGTSMASTAAR